MSGMLSSGLAGLRAFQLAIDVTSQNVVNANTEGYVRQRAELSTRPAVPTGGAWLASGVKVAQVVREFDRFIVEQTRDAGTGAAEAETSASEIGRVLDALGVGDGSLAAVLGRLRSSIDAIAADPTTRGTRAAFVSELDNTVNTLRGLDTRWCSLKSEWTDRIDQGAAEVTALGAQMAELNRQLAIGAAATGSPSPVLLDQRDILLDRLATFAELRVVEEDDGRINVFVGRGQALVVGDTAVIVRPNQFDANSGGSLGALARCRDEVLVDARDDLRDFVESLTSTFNTVHSAGVDAGGAQCADLLSHGSAAEGLVQSLRSQLDDPLAFAAALPGRGVGDNGNARSLAEVAGSLVQTANDLRYRIAVIQQTSARESEVRSSSKDDLQRTRSNLSGVNLDEEAARLLQLQHAYQAAAQVVRMSDELFRTLIDSVR